jgi:hypothetical protein
MKTLVIAILFLFFTNACLYAQIDARYSPDTTKTICSVKDSLLTTSNDTLIDRIVNDELKFMQLVFSIKIQLLFYRQMSNHLTDAFYTPEVFDRRFDYGTVFISLNLLNKYHGDYWINLIVPLIMSEAFGSTISYLYNKEQLVGIKSELFSGFMAGTYLYLRQTVKIINLNDILALFQKIQDTDFGDVTVHGLPQLKSYAILQGYRTAQWYNTNHKYYNIKISVNEAEKFAHNYDASLYANY